MCSVCFSVGSLQQFAGKIRIIRYARSNNTRTHTVHVVRSYIFTHTHTHIHTCKTDSHLRALLFTITRVYYMLVVVRSISETSKPKHHHYHPQQTTRYRPPPPPASSPVRTTAVCSSRVAVWRPMQALDHTTYIMQIFSTVARARQPNDTINLVTIGQFDTQRESNGCFFAGRRGVWVYLVLYYIR